MRAAAALLVGEHDFRSFCVTNSAIGKRTVRRVETIEIAEEYILGEPCLTVRVVGNAFLHSMVRTIVGSLAEVGVGRYEPGWVGEALAAKERSAAGQTAPACGLTLWSVEYPDEVWLNRSVAGLPAACGSSSSAYGYARRRLFDASRSRSYYVRVRFSSPVKVRFEHAKTIVSLEDL